MNDESQLRRLCWDAANLAADFPRGQQVDVDPEADIGVILTAYWNVGLTRAAGLVARTIIDMSSRRAIETILVRRAPMELFANLAVLNKDPANAVRFSSSSMSRTRSCLRPLSAMAWGRPRTWRRRARSSTR